jgi:hypothetical protein
MESLSLKVSYTVTPELVAVLEMLGFCQLPFRPSGLLSLSNPLPGICAELALSDRLYASGISAKLGERREDGIHLSRVLNQALLRANQRPLSHLASLCH